MAESNIDPLADNPNFPAPVVLKADQAALAASIAGRNAQESCAFPRSLSGAAFLREITSALGSILVTTRQDMPEEGGIAAPYSYGWFGMDDFVSATKSGDNSGEVLTRFHTAGALVSLRFNIFGTCAMVALAE